MIWIRWVMRVEIVYPVIRDRRAPIGRLVLRTEADWDADIEPTSVSASGACFDIRWQGPTFAVKPCLRDGQGLRWSQGVNYVLSADEPDPQIYPFFEANLEGSVSDVMRLAGPGGEFSLRVYVPPGYDENTLRRFPVIYMQDGKNLFFPEEAFAGEEWRVDETMDRLDEMNAIRKAIVVGVSPPDRGAAYTAPGYEEYGRFMAEVLKPWVDARWRTRCEAESTIVMGSSLGGVASLHLAWAHPTVFGRAACLSSTFGHADDLFERVGRDPKPAIQIYLDSGWPRDNYDATNAMRDRLVARGFRLGEDLLHFSFPDGVHSERSWAMRVHLPFQFFLGRAWTARSSSR
jgi:predicted alpha/beta superfamily hydrolase